MKNKNIKKLRFIIGIAILVFVTISAYLHQVLGGGAAPSVHALCPYGAIESGLSLFTKGTLIEKIFTGTFVLFIGSIILGIIFRRSFCGVICPFGFLQELFGKLGILIFKRKFEINKKIDRPLRFIKYFVLVFTVVTAWYTASLWIAPYDPWTAYSHISSSELFTGYLVGLIILIISIVGSMLYGRFFCKYLCPMGAFLGIISKLSPNKIVRDKNKCVSCNLCTKNCPMNIKVSEAEEVKSAECINCQSCVLSCPVKGALQNKQGKKSISPLKYIVITLAIFFGIILATKVIGIYEVTPKTAANGSIKTTEQAEENIKGFMTLEEVSKATGIKLEKIYTRAGFTKEQVPPDTKCKEIGTKLGKSFETSELREVMKQILEESK